MKKLLILATVFLVGVSFTSAQTKPAPGTDPESLSYTFYLYYSNGQLLGDRDYAVKYDVVADKFTQEAVGPKPYRGEITNSKFEVIKTFQFDPQKGDLNFKTGKITVKGPYASNGFRANFFDPTGNPVLAIFVSDSAMCNGDGFCSAESGEDNKTCPTDCQAPRVSPTPSTDPIPVVDEGFTLLGLDTIQIVTYLVAGLGVGFIAWLGWKWWKKKKEGDFPLPPRSTPPMAPPSIPSFGG